MFIKCKRYGISLKMKKFLLYVIEGKLLGRNTKRRGLLPIYNGLKKYTNEIS